MGITEHKSTYLAQVKTSAWRDAFLKKVDAVDGFKKLVGHSRDPNARSKVKIDYAILSSSVARVIQDFNADELTAARQYYNNAHLLGYWRMFCGELERLIANGDVDADFPLFQLQEKKGGGVKASSVSLEFFDQVKFDDDERLLVRNENNPEGAPVLLKTYEGTDGKAQAALNRVFLRCSLMDRIIRSTFGTLYNRFLSYQSRQRSPLWDYYKIHYFLDNYLYINETGVARRSPFEFVFGNSNLYELKLFMQFCLDRKIKIKLGDIKAFLGHQNKLSLKLALNISLEENEIHNQRKDLLAYDDKVGVVRAMGVTTEIINHYHDTVIKPYGIIKQSGCPFAMSKGLSENALIEVFEFSDKLMLRLLEYSLNFRRVYPE